VTLGLTLPTLVVLLMVAFDLQNLLVFARRSVSLPSRSSEDFTILVPIYGKPEYLANVAFLEGYKERVLIVANCTTAEMATWADGLEGDGWGVCRTYIRDKISPAQMMKEGIGAVTTTYAVRLDGDSTIEGNIGQAIAAMERRRKHLCSVRVLPSRRQTFAEKMQGVEYDIAMRNRHIRPWTTSGACYVGSTAALRLILSKHTCWYSAEDVEMGLLAKHYKMNVGYLDLTAYTDAPPDFKTLARQRRAWWAGAFRISIVNADNMLHYPIRQFYGVALVYLLLIGRWTSAFSSWQLIPLIALVYVAVTTLTNWPVRSRWFLVFPLYAMAQSAIFPVVGAWWFIKLRIETGRRARLTVRRRRERWALEGAR
jgi:hypothetical protein